MLAVGATLLAVVITACTSGDGSPSSQPSPSSEPLPTVIVGSAGFTESAVVGEIYAQALEAAGFTVERHLYFGTRETTQPALESGQLNLMPEYIGSLTVALGGEASSDPAATLTALQALLAVRELVAFDLTPGADSDGFAVRSETADQYGLETISDLAEIADQLTWGLPPECPERPLCGPGLLGVYGIDISAVPVENLDACSSAMAQALDAGAIDVARVCTTQAQIAQFNFVLLDDDGGLNPAQNMVPVVTAALAEAGGTALADTLNAVSAELSTEALTLLQLQVDIELADLDEVAHQWLVDNGLV
jgi:osmoprotectant transport system substrate-binding protein